ncbi:MAG: hypothetical protein QM763_08655 [Agriterribacter sp.]
MDNTYDYITNRPKTFKQLAANDLLFLHYKCPQENKYIYVYNHFNQIAVLKMYPISAGCLRRSLESRHCNIENG